MKKKFKFYLILIIGVFAFDNLLAIQSDYFSKAKLLFDNKDFEKSKFFFEKDIVFNPRSENSYLYLAKIFKKNENDEQEEKNLDTVLLLNPKNEEAMYLLTLLKIKQSDYNGARDLIKKFELVCKSFCNKKNEIQNKFNKLIPKNEKNKN
tara:strand:- start:448 stop:897 length:450 start_codon:yes stop_codon:yes gene_type:complete